MAQELAAHDIDLYYYDRSKIGEVDFLVQSGRRVTPLEAKSGKDHRRRRALDKFMAVEEWGLDEGIVVCQGNIEHEGKIVYLPWYALAFVNKALGQGDKNAPFIMEP